MYCSYSGNVDTVEAPNIEQPVTLDNLKEMSLFQTCDTTNAFQVIVEFVLMGLNCTPEQVMR